MTGDDRRMEPSYKCKHCGAAIDKYEKSKKFITCSFCEHKMKNPYYDPAFDETLINHKKITKTMDQVNKKMNSDEVSKRKFRFIMYLTIVVIIIGIIFFVERKQDDLLITLVGSIMFSLLLVVPFASLIEVSMYFYGIYLEKETRKRKENRKGVHKVKEIENISEEEYMLIDREVDAILSQYNNCRLKWVYIRLFFTLILATILFYLDVVVYKTDPWMDSLKLLSCTILPVYILVELYIVTFYKKKFVKK